MEPPQKLKLLFVINPVSGGVSKEDWESGIRAYFEDKPFSIEFVRLDGKNDSELVRRKVEDWQPDRAVAVGGDGTVKIVAEQLLSTAIPLGILPAGSANGMARELELPLTLPEALDVIVEGAIKPVDVLLINKNDICLHLSDIGMNAQLVKYFQENNWRGKFGYARGVLRVLWRKRQLHVQITMPDGVVQRQAFMVVLANARMYGTGAMINPIGELSDGLFEVVILRQFSWVEVVKMFWHFRSLDPNKTEIFQAKAIHIETRRRAYFQIDGEYRGRIKEIEAQILPGKLKMLMPASVLKIAEI